MKQPIANGWQPTNKKPPPMLLSRGWEKQIKLLELF